MTRARRCVLLAVFAYVLLDLCSPLVPGAFSFDPQLSVDGLGGARVRQAAPPRIEAAAPPVLRVAPLPLPPVRSQALQAAQLAWWPHLARDHAALMADPRPSPEDH